ncbi:putative low-redox potential cytochrome [Rippkaea orientalis PCC 8801]|uniref:Putative low-redox potential cytochrome n=1 Tax=Rippkaea orientalis (strain PCC 8801 / RF-1) TaxID=41431 RepID=B7K4G6_RIPO1|nr:low-redox potential cytochrome [Rippkaea orientalis]ACK65431.1 putative low-redox potential cytochrome [Rippkaea orientalis PCC 8801]
MFKLSKLSLIQPFKPVSLLVWLAIALWSIGLGWGITHTLEAIAASPDDAVSARFEAGKELYRETCGSCHLALPPDVLPTETWQKLLEKPNDHYGTSIPNLIRLSQLLIWDYLRTFSRPIPTKNDPIPFYVAQSRYFKILHPRVEFTDPVTHKSCIVCHPGVKSFNFRTLTPQWDDAP